VVSSEQDFGQRWLYGAHHNLLAQERKRKASPQPSQLSEILPLEEGLRLASPLV
jgi:hypothetical protein